MRSKLWESSTVPWCGYADVLILFMLDIHSLQRARTILDEVFTNYDLCINVSKTETTILNHMLLEDEYSDTIISLCNVSLQNPTEFKYLGSYISQNTNLTRETLKLITVSRWHTQNLLPWPTSFKTLRLTLKPESSF